MCFVSVFPSVKLKIWEGITCSKSECFFFFFFCRAFVIYANIWTPIMHWAVMLTIFLRVGCDHKRSKATDFWSNTCILQVGKVGPREKGMWLLAWSHTRQTPQEDFACPFEWLAPTFQARAISQPFQYATSRCPHEGPGGTSQGMRGVKASAIANPKNLGLWGHRSTPPKAESLPASF